VSPFPTLLSTPRSTRISLSCCTLSGFLTVTLITGNAFATTGQIIAFVIFFLLSILIVTGLSCSSLALCSRLAGCCDLCAMLLA
jgi:hypothetical protein